MHAFNQGKEVNKKLYSKTRTSP